MSTEHKALVSWNSLVSPVLLGQQYTEAFMDHLPCRSCNIALACTRLYASSTLKEVEKVKGFNV